MCIEINKMYLCWMGGRVLRQQIRGESNLGIKNDDREYHDRDCSTQVNQLKLKG